ncbi:mitochondrial ribosomal subunit protein-domain-containing protein [Chaetomidium leptoderma]|uniref:Mitochondrial ribosomal subunit protein-domain-containing protein n=1 Tax=Chaetomidium leptoderma TaxID=669021 RepID=A0AAN6VH30_9PEZI|nr:mitochondrial ribosomal subunit protein-domain-containing protein [Chaetomidium leptoderma]
MASHANLLRLCLRPSKRLPNLRAAAVQQHALRRSLSTTQWRSAAAGDAGNKEAQDEFDQVFSNPGQFLQNFLRDEKISDEERKIATAALADWKKTPRHKQAQFEDLAQKLTDQSAPLRRAYQPKKDSFWNAEETDTDLITGEVGEDDFEEDDIMALGHAKLEEHREFREYARIAVWEMPLLSKLAKPFQPPTADEVLRFRYTTYMGEFHPADRKVVVEFSPQDFPGLNEAQQLKLKKLAGSRYNPEKDIIKISCERFEHQAQNKRYLGDLVDQMITTAKDPTDMFEDIPLDTRHHKFKPQIKFPKEWYMTEERKKELEAQRKQALLLDEAKRTDGSMINGADTIQQALLTAKKAEAAAPSLVRVRPMRGRR